MCTEVIKDVLRSLKERMGLEMTAGLPFHVYWIEGTVDGESKPGDPGDMSQIVEKTEGLVKDLLEEVIKNNSILSYIKIHIPNPNVGLILMKVIDPSEKLVKGALKVNTCLPLPYTELLFGVDLAG